jgi:hypothetical protein
MAMAFTRQQTIAALLDAEDDLGDAWADLTTAVVRNLEGWDDPQSRVTDARWRLRLATGTANAALEQALSEAVA